MIRTLGIAVLNRGDLLLRCIESVDRPIETLFIVNNGSDPGVAAALSRIEKRQCLNSKYFEIIKIDHRKENMGCGPAWNHVIQTSPGWWLLAGSDVKFGPGSLDKIYERSKESDDISIICADGYNIFAMSPLGVSKVGLFDENFYPAYFEDVDHFRRVALSGARAVNVPGFSYVHGEAPHWGSSTIHSDPEIRARNGRVMENLSAYYIRKWGGPPGKEVWKTPYNRPVTLDFVELDSDLRHKNSLW